MKKNPVIKIDFLKTPTDDFSTVEGLKKYWKSIKPLIEQREKHFADVWKNGSEEEIFAELVFCLFTPQSKAVSCWAAVNNLADKNMIFKASADEIAKTISGVRFHSNKSRFVIGARALFTAGNKMRIKEKLASFNDIYELREWIIKNIKGIGYKEAGHFLRNIGIGKDLAILDRHILKNLKVLGAIKEIPKTLTPKIYKEIESQMMDFCKKIKIPMSHMDMVLWCKESGGIFK
ncbi:MAG: N-glycosylase/DNA lyase [Endomicrobia bacterium]|nr:N-glycosylase/DNA lyase [Endomicrobiia bacterium]MCL2507383.1 N-glycosylase/DNA lyase [Endomicrobiia bacterium]